MQFDAVIYIAKNLKSEIEILIAF